MKIMNTSQEEGPSLLNIVNTLRCEYGVKFLVKNKEQWDTLSEELVNHAEILQPPLEFPCLLISNGVRSHIYINTARSAYDEKYFWTFYYVYMYDVERLVEVNLEEE